MASQSSMRTLALLQPLPHTSPLAEVMIFTFTIHSECNLVDLETFPSE